MIKTIDELKRAIDNIWPNIGDSCSSCSEPDCLGYIPVLLDEEESLLAKGVQTVQLNGEHGPIFLDSYRRDPDGALVVGHSKPQCPYRDLVSGVCTVHAVRPLMCHLYPLGPETLPNGDFVWGLHEECAYVKKVDGAGQMESLMSALKDLLAEIDPALRDKLYDLYQKVDYVSIQPNGPNLFRIVAPI